MFGNKKNNLPPRPSLPTPEQMFEDLRNSTASDVAFNILAKDDKQSVDLHFPTHANDVENIYGKAKTYLDGNRRLKMLGESLNTERESLQISYDEIVKLAQDIRDQAQAMLIK